ncbi:MAG TPA: M42 family peptidase, partial [bacterium]|nr:M42 family peptidase [bacterium]
MLTDLLERLSSIDGPSGYERDVIECMRKEAGMIPGVFTEVDILGNFIVRKEGKGKKIALFAHADEIGFVLTRREEGNYWRFSTIGGIDP